MSEGLSLCRRARWGDLGAGGRSRADWHPQDLGDALYRSAGTFFGCDV